jgi:hypothetical protein
VTRGRGFCGLPARVEVRASGFGQNINYYSLWSSGQYSDMLACANLGVHEIVCVDTFGLPTTTGTMSSGGP